MVKAAGSPANRSAPPPKEEILLVGRGLGRSLVPLALGPRPGKDGIRAQKRDDLRACKIVRLAEKQLEAVFPVRRTFPRRCGRTVRMARVARVNAGGKGRRVGRSPVTQPWEEEQERHGVLFAVWGASQVSYCRIPDPASGKLDNLTGEPNGRQSAPTPGGGSVCRRKFCTTVKFRAACEPCFGWPMRDKKHCSALSSSRRRQLAGPQAHACQLSQDGRVEALGPLVEARPAQFQKLFQHLGGLSEFAGLEGEIRGPARAWGAQGKPSVAPVHGPRCARAGCATVPGTPSSGIPASAGPAAAAPPGHPAEVGSVPPPRP